MGVRVPSCAQNATIKKAPALAGAFFVVLCSGGLPDDGAVGLVKPDLITLLHVKCLEECVDVAQRGVHTVAAY